jgi:hypothetical protein
LVKTTKSLQFVYIVTLPLTGADLLGLYRSSLFYGRQNAALR